MFSTGKPMFVGAQTKLLRVLQEGEVHRLGGTAPIPVDVRVIAATNQDLDARRRAHSFRSDLFYRLSVFPIQLPALRERPDDIGPLASSFLARVVARQHRPASPWARARILAGVLH